MAKEPHSTQANLYSNNAILFIVTHYSKKIRQTQSGNLRWKLQSRFVVKLDITTTPSSLLRNILNTIGISRSYLKILRITKTLSNTSPYCLFLRYVNYISASYNS